LAPDKVYLSSLKLADFRNYADLALTLNARPVVLTGPNGAGKTNILEAVSLLSPGRGLRRARLAEIARHDGDGRWAVAATITGPGGNTDIGTGLAAGEDGPARQRSVRINHAPAPNSQALLEYLRVVWLTPAMDGLFTGATSDRRRFLDRLVLAIDTRHADRVNAYERAMRERNRLFAEGRNDAQWLDALEAQMAEHGVAIAAARKECVARLTDAIAAAGFDGPFPAATLGVAGTVEETLDAATATEAEDRFRQVLAASRPADRAAKRTLAGPHLSDLSVVHAPKQTPAADCSTGEQKALLVGIVLAHARLIARLSGETPILLLDEIGAHLDEARRADLFRILVELGAQAWLTGTDPGPFEPLGEAAQFMAVADGKVSAAAAAD
jgi:DNA replication and repair protein RecF